MPVGQRHPQLRLQIGCIAGLQGRCQSRFDCLGFGPGCVERCIRQPVNTAGQDLLNSRIKGSYSTVILQDLLGQKDLQAITGYSFPKDADTVVYMDYPAGAIRLKVDSLSNDNVQTYYSRFVIRLTKTDAVPPDDFDTIKIEYKSTASLFQISKLWYNNELKFTKVPGQPNIVKIIK